MVVVVGSEGAEITVVVVAGATTGAVVLVREGGADVVDDPAGSPLSLVQAAAMPTKAISDVANDRRFSESLLGLAATYQ